MASRYTNKTRFILGFGVKWNLAPYGAIPGPQSSNLLVFDLVEKF